MSVRKVSRTTRIEEGSSPEAKSVPHWFKIACGVACALLLVPVVAGLMLSMFLAIAPVFVPIAPLWIYLMHGDRGREVARKEVSETPKDEGHEERPHDRSPLWSTFAPAR